MACIYTLNGIDRECLSNRGGITWAAFANKEDVTSVTVSNDQITAIAATDGAFKTYKVRRATSSMDSNFAADDAAGTGYWQTDLLLQFSKMETVKRTEVAALVKGEFVAIVRDNNGKYWYMGFDDYVSATAGTAATGTANADFNGYTLTATDYSDDPPYEVTADAISALGLAA